jgi:Zn-finger nucleic acid-binding protein
VLQGYKGLAKVYRCPYCRGTWLVWVQVADLTEREATKVAEQNTLKKVMNERG